jgi:hypothetical protein
MFLLLTLFAYVPVLFVSRMHEEGKPSFVAVA